MDDRRHPPRVLRPKIAVINDDTTFLPLMRELLEELGEYEVVSCIEADGAHAFVKAERPDAIVLDIRLDNEYSGWLVLDLLTLDPLTRPIPLIVCSAAVLELRARQEQLDELGVDVLPKPFDIDALLRKISEGLARDSA